MTNRPMIIVVATFMILALTAGAIWALQGTAERIDISELKKKLDSGEKLLLIDVREDWDWKKTAPSPAPSTSRWPSWTGG